MHRINYDRCHCCRAEKIIPVIVVNQTMAAGSTGRHFYVIAVKKKVTSATIQLKCIIYLDPVTKIS